MKILLMAINAKYIHSNPAVYDLLACAHQYRQSVAVREYTINQPREDILKDIYLIRPDVVCISCYIWNISVVTDIVCDLKKVLPGAAFWAGGPEVSYHAEKFLEEHKEFTGIMTGEGERSFAELCGYYTERRPDLRTIRGIVYRDPGTGDVYASPPAEPLPLDEIPFIYQDLQKFANRIIYYESSRGCPFSCSYCLSSIEKTLRFRSLSLVLPELQFFLDRQVPQVKFVDRTFNCDHRHCTEIWTYIRDHDNGVTNFHFEIAADLLTEEELALLSTMRPGLIQLEIGVQSTNPDTLKEIRRKTDLRRLAHAVRTIRGFHNIHQHLDLIAGLPLEDYASFRRSFNDVYALKPDQLQLGFLKVLKGSFMEEKAGDYRLVTRTREPYEVLSTAWLSYSDVLRLKSVENMVEIYYNTGQFRTTLALMEEAFPDPFAMFRRLGDHYDRKEYASVSHSRIRRYEILLEFLDESGFPRDQVRDCLMKDLYLREKLKSRPSFALDQKPFEKKIRAFREEKGIPKTAHIEVFRNGEAVLFLYEHRDPLTGNAETRRIELE